LPTSTPARRSRSGITTRPGSGSKGRSAGSGRGAARGPVGCVRTGGSRSMS
jgi:hypothetical protein